MHKEEEDAGRHEYRRLRLGYTVKYEINEDDPGGHQEH